MLLRLRKHIHWLRANYDLMRRAAEAVSEEFQRMSASEIDSLLDNPAAAHEFDRDFDGVRIHFVLQEWDNGGDLDRRVFSVNASGLKTLIGVKPGSRFSKHTN